jgi:hypothetical protein
VPSVSFEPGKSQTKNEGNNSRHQSLLSLRNRHRRRHMRGILRFDSLPLTWIDRSKVSTYSSSGHFPMCPQRPIFPTHPHFVHTSQTGRLRKIHSGWL